MYWIRMVPNTLSCQLNKKYENLKSQTLTVACGTDLIHDAGLAIFSRPLRRTWGVRKVPKVDLSLDFLSFGGIFYFWANFSMMGWWDDTTGIAAKAADDTAITVSKEILDFFHIYYVYPFIEQIFYCIQW